MNASDLIKEMIKLGVAVKDAASKSSSAKGTDWDAVLKALAGDANVKTTLTRSRRRAEVRRRGQGHRRGGYEAAGDLERPHRGAAPACRADAVRGPGGRTPLTRDPATHRRDGREPRAMAGQRRVADAGRYCTGRDSVVAVAPVAQRSSLRDHVAQPAELGLVRAAAHERTREPGRERPSARTGAAARPRCARARTAGRYSGSRPRPTRRTSRHRRRASAPSRVGRRMREPARVEPREPLCAERVADELLRVEHVRREHRDRRHLWIDHLEIEPVLVGERVGGRRAVGRFDRDAPASRCCGRSRSRRSNSRRRAARRSRASRARSARPVTLALMLRTVCRNASWSRFMIAARLTQISVCGSSGLTNKPDQRSGACNTFIAAP